MVLWSFAELVATVLRDDLAGLLSMMDGYPQGWGAAPAAFVTVFSIAVVAYAVGRGLAALERVLSGPIRAREYAHFNHELPRDLLTHLADLGPHRVLAGEPKSRYTGDPVYTPYLSMRADLVRLNERQYERTEFFFGRHGDFFRTLHAAAIVSTCLLAASLLAEGLFALVAGNLPTEAWRIGGRLLALVVGALSVVSFLGSSYGRALKQEMRTTAHRWVVEVSGSEAEPEVRAYLRKRGGQSLTHEILSHQPDQYHPWWKGPILFLKDPFGRHRRSM